MRWFEQLATLKHIGIAVAAFGLTLVAIDKTVEYVAVIEKKEQIKIGFDTDSDE